MDANSLFFASIAPRSHSNKIPVAAAGPKVEEDSISKGTFTPCFSRTNFEVTRCNHRLLASSKSDVGRKVWKSIVRLGVSFGGSKTSGIEMVERME